MENDARRAGKSGQSGQAEHFEHFEQSEQSEHADRDAAAGTGRAVGLDADVLVAGAGPVGCWLAAELSAAGLRVLLLEARAGRPEWSRGFTIHPRTLEILDGRGLAEPLLEAGGRAHTWHFAMGRERLDFAALPTRFPFVLLYPQAATEELLEGRLAGLGAPVRREHRVTGLRQFDDRVEAAVETPTGRRTLTARYLVGCDGAHSAVREAAGIAFTGEGDRVASPGAVVVLDDPPPPERYMQTYEAGIFFVLPLPDRRFMLTVMDHATMRDTGAEASFELLRAATIRVTGRDYGMRDPQRLSMIGSAAKQAAHYRAGRVLLAGDAAHVHYPLGGQGMNLGIQDAHNLAWRLAAVLGAGASDRVLDGYEAERKPVGAQVVDDVRVQMSIVTATGADGVALRARFETLLRDHASIRREYALRMAGLAVRYGAESVPDGASHDLSHAASHDVSHAADARIGARVPDLPLDVAAEPQLGAAAVPTRLFALHRPGRFLFLDLTGDETVATAATTASVFAGTGFAGLVDTVSARLGPSPDPWCINEGWHKAPAILIRPDGHAAWIGSRPEHAAAALAALLA